MSSTHRIALLAALALAGCNQLRPPVEPRSDPYDRAQIHMDTDELKRDTAVGRPILARDDAGLLHITVPVRSVIDRQLHVEYRVTFFDQHGQVLNQTSWFDKTLPPNTPDQVEVNSTSSQAADFQIDFRYPPGY